MNDSQYRVGRYGAIECAASSGRSKEDPTRNARAPSEAESGESVKVDSISATAATPSMDSATKPIASTVRTAICDAVNVDPETLVTDVVEVSGSSPSRSLPVMKPIPDTVITAVKTKA